MKRTRIAPRGYCPAHELRFAIVAGDGRYLAAKDVPIQWDADVDNALLLERRREADAFLMQYRIGLRRCRVVQVREEVVST